MTAPDPHIPGWQILYILIITLIALIALFFLFAAIFTGQLLFLIPAGIVAGFGVAATLPWRR